MQSVSQNYLDALGGFFRLTVQVDAWRDGRCIAQDLPVSGGSLTVTDGQAIRSRLTLSITDPDGEFTPRSMSDPLAPFGSELNVKAGITVGPMTEMLSLGWFPIQSAESHEEFGTYERPDEPGRVYRVVRGATTLIEALDRAQLVAEDRFMTREQPTAGGTVLGEIARLLGGRVPYAGSSGVTDRSIPAKFTYDDDRLKGVTDLADVVDADLIFTPNGSALIKGRAAAAPVWTIPDGPGGYRVSMTRRMQRDGVYNAVVARGQTDDNQTLQGIAVTVDGPTRYNGPFGRVPYFYASPLLGTQNAVNEAAQTVLSRISTVKPQKVQVVCVLNPALTAGDTVRLPVSGGYIDGRVAEITFPLESEATTMTLGVTIDPLSWVVPT